MLADAGADVSYGALGSRMTPTHLAAATGIAGVLRVLLEVGPDIERGADGGQTPAHVAAASGCSSRAGRHLTGTLPQSGQRSYLRVIRSNGGGGGEPRWL